MNIDGKKILVAGFGVTGKAVVEFLSRRRCTLLVSDSRPRSEFGDIPDRYPEVRFEFGKQKPETFENVDLIILSPGIPDTIPPLIAAREKQISIISELELAFHHLKGTLIGITGTNGKSTTTELTGALLKEGGKQTFVCGNIGIPLIEFCDNSNPGDYYVIEISSFQLETIDEFRPHIAALINLAEDHLDRYPDAEPYYQAKMRIFKNQKQTDFAVINYDDPYIRRHLHQIPSNHFWFSRNEIPASGLYAKEGLIRSVSGASIVNFNYARLKGVHNLENTLCAASIAMLCGVRPKAMQRALETFTGLHHRMELVKESKGVRYFDDSKATNVDAVVKSVQSFDGNIFLIMGGKDKGCDYRALRLLVKDRVKELLLIGEAKDRIAKELSEVKTPRFFESLEDAVRFAHDHSEAGDVVLLSPACSSFDMFRNYEHRGEVFRAAIRDVTS
jgi:UDP-N-acetylmuramoylalanine--D-glutamate ligase